MHTKEYTTWIMCYPLNPCFRLRLDELHVTKNRILCRDKFKRHAVREVVLCKQLI